MEWDTEFRSLRLGDHDADPVEAVLTVPGGPPQRVLCEWLVGCDGAQVLAGAHALTGVIMGHRTPLAERLAVARHPEFSRTTVEKVSGLAYSYRGHLDVPPLADPLDGLSAGDRVPDLALGAGRQLHHLLRHPDHTLRHIPSPGKQVVTEHSRQLTARHPGRLQPHCRRGGSSPNLRCTRA